jgi:hypothetical protein
MTLDEVVHPEEENRVEVEVPPLAPRATITHQRPLYTARTPFGGVQGIVKLAQPIQALLEQPLGEAIARIRSMQHGTCPLSLSSTPSPTTRSSFSLLLA